MDNFASNLKFLREKKGLTQTAMFDEIGFSRTTWNNYETGSSYPSFRDLIKIANYFDISIDDVVSGDVSNGQMRKRHKKKLQKDPISQLEMLQSDYDSLKKQLDFANKTIKSLTEHVDTLKDTMKIQMARLEDLQHKKR